MLKKSQLACLLMLASISAAVSASEVGVQVQANLEAVLEAQEIQDRGVRLVKRLQQMLDEARGEGDIIKVTALNDLLTQANAALRSTEQRTSSLREALDMKNKERANHEFKVLKVLGQKIDEFGQKASQVIGQAVFDGGAAEITTTTDEGTTTVPTASPVVMPPSPGGGSSTSVKAASSAVPPPL